MLTGTEELLSIAEIALALTAFAALVIVLAARDQTLHPTAGALTQSLALVSLGAGLLCLLPIVLFRLGMEEPLLWRVASIVASINGFVMGIVASAAAGMRLVDDKIRADDPDSRAPALGLRGLALLSTLPIGPWLVFVSLAVGWPWPASLGGFMLGVFLMLVAVGLQFFAAIITLLGHS